MGRFSKMEGRMKITSFDGTGEDERNRQYGFNEPVAPIDIERVEAPVTFKVA